MKRRLTLRRDHLGELTSDELSAVHGGNTQYCTTQMVTWTRACPATYAPTRCLSLDGGWSCPQTG